MKLARAIFLLLSVVAAAGCFARPSGSEPTPDKPNVKSIVVAGGCFWCVEAVFEDLKGVIDVESAYVGGTVPSPTYEQICTGRTGAAEAVKITYDANIVGSDELLKIFFTTHDPTSLNKQGPDIGTQYRSAIFYSTETERELAYQVIQEVTRQKLFKGKIVTTVEPLTNYTRAEEYHQNYYRKYTSASPAQQATMNAGYCANIVTPKVMAFRAKYKDRLKKSN